MEGGEMSHDWVGLVGFLGCNGMETCLLLPGSGTL